MSSDKALIADVVTRWSLIVGPVIVGVLVWGASSYTLGLAAMIALQTIVGAIRTHGGRT